MRMEYHDITYEKRDGIAIATLDRPEQLNSFRDNTFREVLDVLEDVESDLNVRCLVLTGNGRAFSAGQDLRELQQVLEAGASSPASHANLERLQEITRRIVSLDRPVIVAVNGVAVGAGVEIAIASDIRIASENASFAFPEVRHGLFETNGVMFFLPRIVGYGRAMEWLLTGRRVSADEALAAGLVTHLVPADQLVPKALELAEEIKGNAPISVRLIKKTGLEALTLDLESVLAKEVEGMKECLVSSDLQEGVHAFLEKRRPAFSGT
jgi:enoyl-CoA hydratase/carnithine racemase